MSAPLDEFVRDALNHGQKPDQIRAELIAAGWSPKEVDSTLASWTVASFGLAIPKPRTYVSAREAFLYVVMFSLLALVSYNLGALLFSLIDGAIADALDQSPGYLRETSIRGSLSALAVATPLLAAFGWYIGKQRRANPAMEQSRVRKWLTYVTLMCAALVLVGDLIALVFSFLSGELSERLLLKLIVVAVIASGIFAFFVGDVEQTTARGRLVAARILAASGATAVAAAFLAGYLSIQNPIAVRELRLDSVRLATLKSVAAAAQCAYSFTGRIPASLQEIRADFEERRVAVGGGNCTVVQFSPQDEAVVKYQLVDETHIRLCTDFRRATGEISADPSFTYRAPHYPASFPELDEKRAAGGPHCYRIRMVKLPAPAALPGAIPAPP